MELSEMKLYYCDCDTNYNNFEVHNILFRKDYKKAFSDANHALTSGQRKSSIYTVSMKFYYVKVILFLTN